MGSLLKVHQISAGYEGHVAIEGISFEIREREILSLIGPNGAGKSTLLKVIAGLLVPYKGELIGLEGIKKAYVPQQRAWDRFLPMTVMEFLSLQPETSFWPFRMMKTIRQKAMRALDRMGVGALSRRTLGQLSGGECERVMIAFALMSEPKLLLLDEPLAGVDVKGGYDFEKVIRELNKEDQMTVVMVSHDLHLVSHLSDRVACLNHRSLHHIGTPEEVMREHVLSGIYGLPPSSVQHLKGLESMARRVGR
jgi:zinc transport system ATP-binding protein